MAMRGRNYLAKQKKCKHTDLMYARKNKTIRCMECKKFWIDPFDTSGIYMSVEATGKHFNPDKFYPSGD